MPTSLNKLETGRLRRALQALDVLSRAAMSAEQKLAVIARSQGAWYAGNRRPPSGYSDILGDGWADGGNSDKQAETLPEVLARVAQAAEHASAAVDYASDMIAAFEKAQREDSPGDLERKTGTSPGG